MKSLVQTTGQFELHDVDAKQTVTYDRPSVVEMTAFIHQRLAIGQIKTLRGDLPASATDKEFAKFFADSAGDTNLAVESFLSSLPEDGEDVAAQTGYSGKPIEGSEESVPPKAPAKAPEVKKD